MVGAHALLVKYFSSPVSADAAPVVIDHFTRLADTPRRCTDRRHAGACWRQVMLGITLIHQATGCKRLSELHT